MNALDKIVRINIGQEKIEKSIVVIVKELEAPAAQESCRHPNSRGSGLIVERPIMIVLVNCESLHINVGDEQIHPPILVEVGRIEAHPGACTTVSAVGNTGKGSCFFKSPLTTIHENEVRCCVIADK